jgi:hypothetical protein
MSKSTLAVFLMSIVVVPLSAQVTADPEGGILYSDGFESGNTLAWPDRVPPLAPPDAFRMLDLDLRDPHVFVDIPGFGCLDFTDEELPLGLGPSFNDLLQTAIETDSDLDGFLDFSFILGFRPFSEAAVDERIDAGCGQCTDPPATTVCDWDRTVAIPRTTSYDALTAGTCLEALPGTTSSSRKVRSPALWSASPSSGWRAAWCAASSAKRSPTLSCCPALPETSSSARCYPAVRAAVPPAMIATWWTASAAGGSTSSTWPKRSPSSAIRVLPEARHLYYSPRRSSGSSWARNATVKAR